MKRWIWILPLLAMPVLAQEEEKKEAEKIESKEPGPQELYEQAAKLFERIKAAEPEELKRLLEQIEILLRLKSREPGGFQEVHDTVFLEIGDQAGQEKMTGSWSEGDGVSGKYTLTSLGKSRYRLEAERTGAEGEVTKIKDEGTLAELRKKYSFMKTFGFVTIAQSDGPAGFPAFNTNKVLKGFTLAMQPTGEKPVEYRMWEGLKLRRPSKDLEYHLKLPTETAWIVEGVSPGSRGEKLGLQKMDLLTTADAEDLAELKTLENAKESLEIVRRGKAKRVSLRADPDRK